jgi:hypothetical protein
MINNSSLEKWSRLSRKRLSSQFVSAIIEGLSCSPFEAQAVLETVERIFGPYFETSGTLKPGQLQFVVVGESAPPQLPLSRCPMVTVVLTLDADEDLSIRRSGGVTAQRRHRLERLCREAYQQGGLLTLEDLADRLLNTSVRTLCRDLAVLRRQGVVLPLRSTIRDMGRSVSHRALIVRQWLEGGGYTQIAQATRHSPEAIANYVEKFKRVYLLKLEGIAAEGIGFMLKLSPALVGQYLELCDHPSVVAARAEELRQFVKKTAVRSRAPHARGRSMSKQVQQ